MKRKKVFSGTSDLEKKYLDRKVTVTGKGTRAVALTKFIPDSWIYVRIVQVKAEKDYIVLKIIKLLGVDDLAQPEKTRKRREHHT